MTITYLLEIEFSPGAVLVFDLDDTLSQERNYLVSAYQEVAELIGRSDLGPTMVSWYDNKEKDVFGRLLKETGSSVDKAELVSCYREHQPRIALQPATLALLLLLKKREHPLGLLTDGRSVTQRSKIKALGLDEIIEEIVISEEFGSEKPNLANYQHFEDCFPGRDYAYIGDNLKKDFVTPKSLGWTTVCLLDSGHNIHPQNFEDWPESHLPQYRLKRLA